MTISFEGQAALVTGAAAGIGLAAARAFAGAGAAVALADVDDPRSGRRLARWPPPVTGPSRSTDTPMVAATAADHPGHMTALIGQIPARRLRGAVAVQSRRRVHHRAGHRRRRRTHHPVRK